MDFFTFLVLASVAADSGAVARRIEPIVYWSWEAAVLEDGTLADAKQSVVFATRESHGDPTLMSQDGLGCCGTHQLCQLARAGHSCDELAKDPVLTARLWIRWVRMLDGVCGTRERALGAVATGHCGWAKSLVADRCRLAGGC